MERPTRKRTVYGPIVLLGGILTLANLGTILHKSSRVYLFQQALCFNYYQIHDVSKIGTEYRIEEALCKVKAIQARLSIFDGVDAFLQLLPRKSLDSCAKWIDGEMSNVLAFLVMRVC